MRPNTWRRAATAVTLSMTVAVGVACGGRDANAQLEQDLRTRFGDAPADCIIDHAYDNLGERGVDQLAEGGVEALDPNLQATYGQLVVGCVAARDDD